MNKDALDDYPSKKEILKTIFDAVYEQYSKKEWQGLSDNEKLSSIRKWAENNTMRGQELIGLCDAIEQALKDKNT